MTKVRTISRMARRGFSLLELTLVMLILAVMLGMVAPSISGFAEGRKPGEAAHNFATLAQWARDQAVSDGMTIQINIDADNRAWQAVEIVGGQETPINDEMGMIFHADENVDMAASQLNGAPLKRILFEPNGRVDPGVVRFVGSGGMEAHVECTSSLTDYKVVEGNP